MPEENDDVSNGVVFEIPPLCYLRVTFAKLLTVMATGIHVAVA